jgi:hypothetical protein
MIAEAVSARDEGYPDPLADVIDAARAFLYLPDPRPLLALLGTVAANRLPGDPVWFLLVGPPSSGKTELLGALSMLQRTVSVSTFTEAGLLSGSHGRGGSGTGGLLREIGTEGLIVVKDFTTILSEGRDIRSRALSELREVYDGSFSRYIGAEGGRSLVWRGKAGLVAGVTEVIERHQATIGALGERFLYCRMPEPDRLAVARMALTGPRNQRPHRDALAEATCRLFVGPLAAPPPLDASEIAYLGTLVELVTRARSAVHRDSNDREIEFVPGPESVGRLAHVLAGLLGGLRAIGVHDAIAWDVVLSCALDSIPAKRLGVLRVLAAADEGRSSPQVADALRYPTTTIRRTLEELAAHGLVARDASDHIHRWAIDTQARSALERIGAPASAMA